MEARNSNGRTSPLVSYGLLFCGASALSFYDEYPRKTVATLAGNVHLIACTGFFRFPFGDDDPQIAVTLGTGALEVLGHGPIESRRRGS